jgi:hypothetical protein
MEADSRMKFAMDNTVILRPPKQKLATFGSTNVYYYMITELMPEAHVVREGRVIAARPKIVTPAYLINLEGFSSQAKQYLQMMADVDPNQPGILYSYKNQTGEMNIVSNPLPALVERINREIDSREDPLSAIIKGVEDMWDVSLIKFTFELTSSSAYHNYTEFWGRGSLARSEGGIPREAMDGIERLFELCREDASQAARLAAELRRWNLWESYQDRFLQLFKSNP